MDPIKQSLFNNVAKSKIESDFNKTAERKTAEDFESVFLSQVFSEMLSMTESSITGGGHAEETWKSFMAQEYAKEVARNGQTGIADSVEKMLKSYNEIKETQ
mgnify:CR=1 FL=1